MDKKDPAQQEWLESFIARHDGIAGTVHVQRGEDLYLTAAHNIPPPVVAIVAHVPHGKGMAGVAQVKKSPVQTCNLQTDETGNIKPGAKAVERPGRDRVARVRRCTVRARRRRDSVEQRRRNRASGRAGLDEAGGGLAALTAGADALLLRWRSLSCTVPVGCAGLSVT